MSGVRGRGARSLSSARILPVAIAGGLLACAAAFLIANASADPASPITVTMTASASTVASGSQLTYTIVVTNTGGASLSNLVMTDPVSGLGQVTQPPALPQLTITTTKGSCTNAGGGAVTCNAGTLAGNGTWTVTIAGQVTASANTPLFNTATVAGTKSAQNFSTSSNTTTVQVTNGGGGSLPDLTINKTGPTSVAVSSPLTYTLTVGNIGTANASGIEVVDTLPPGVSFVSTSTTSLFACTPTSATPSPVTVDCTGGIVNFGQTGTITINATSPATTGQITNTAVVDPNNTIQESNELNNTSAVVNTQVTATAPAPGPLTITNADSPDPVNPGSTLTYTILVKNTGTGSAGRADDVVVTDETQGLVASSIVASQTIVNGTVGTTGGCNVSGPQVACSISTLNSGGTQQVVITGTVITTAGTSIFNTATVTGNVKNQGVSASSSITTTVRPYVDLTVTNSSPASVCATSWPTDGTNPSFPNQHLPNKPTNATGAASGTIPTLGLLDTPDCLGGLTYTLVVGNSGNGTANSVVVRDPLPAGTIFDSFDADSGVTCSVDGSNVVTCTVPTLGPASTTQINLLLKAPPTVGTITDTATVDPNNAIFESDETNNTATSTTSVTTGVDLTVWKGVAGAVPPGTTTALTAGFDPVATSGTETYTIQAENVGTQDATGIKIVDTLPAHTTFLSASGDHGFTCSFDGTTNVVCVGGHLQGTEARFYNGPTPGNPASPGTRDVATIIIKIFAQPTVGTMHNEVRIDPDNTIAEVNEENNLYTLDTTVTTGNDDKGAYNQLTITKTQVSPDPMLGPVATNGTLVYNLHVSNLGTDPVSAVVVQDFLPAGSRFISAADTAPQSDPFSFFCNSDNSGTGGTITCSGGAFSGTQHQIFENDGVTPVPTSRDIRVTIFAPNTPGSYVNLAKVDPANVIPEGNEFDNASQVTTQVAVAGQNEYNELSVVKTQTSPALNQVATSSTVVYHLVVSNSGSDPAFNVKVVDNLPAGFTYVSAVDLSPQPDPKSFVCGLGSGNQVVCNGATLSGLVNTAPGEPASRTIEVTAVSPASPGTYTNTAIVDPDNTIPEGDETNNTSQVQTKVIVGQIQGDVDLTVTNTASPSTLALGQHATPGGLITYTLVASNGGTNPAFNVKLQDILPAGTTFVSAVDTTPPAGPDPNRFTCSNSSGLVTCTGATLDGSAGLAGVPSTRVITIQVTAPNAVVLGLTDVARIDPDNAIPESNETNNSATSVTDVQSDINLTITGTGPDTAHQNDMTQYVLTVDNTGTAPAKNVLVTDPLPVGLIPLGSVQATPGDFACQVLENPVNVVSCVGDLNGAGDPNGFDTVTITIPVFITADGGTLDNQACVDPNNTIVESNENDNCTTNVTAVVKHAPNMLINTSVDKTTVTAGDPVTYTVNVSNIGDADADGPITVTDTLPGNFTFVGDNPDASFTCPAPSGGVLTCTASGGMTQGASAAITINGTINSPLPSGVTSIVNSATVSPATCSASDCENEAADPSRLADNSASVTSTVGGSSIDLVMTNNPAIDNPDPVVVGQKLTFTIPVTNAGSAGTTGGAVLIRTALPTGLDLDSAAASNGFTCTPAGPKSGPVGNVDCTGDLAAGGSTTITITTTVTASAGTTLTTTSTADPNNTIVESNETNNTVTATTSVVAAPCTSCVDLVAGTISATPSPVTNGNDVTYNFAVTNVGDQPTTVITGADPVEVDINLDKSSNHSTLEPFTAPPGWTCTQNEPPVPSTAPELVCTTTSLAAGAGALFSVTVKANTPTTPSSVDFDVSVDPAHAVSEFNPSNNTAALTVNTQ